MTHDSHLFQNSLVVTRSIHPFTFYRMYCNAGAICKQAPCSFIKTASLVHAVQHLSFCALEITASESTFRKKKKGVKVRKKAKYHETVNFEGTLRMCKHVQRSQASDANGARIAYALLDGVFGRGVFVSLLEIPMRHERDES